jgi:hypothetical protein
LIASGIDDFDIKALAIAFRVEPLASGLSISQHQVRQGGGAEAYQQTKNTKKVKMLSHGVSPV